MKYEILNINSLSDSELELAFNAMSKERRERCLRHKLAEDRKRMIAGELLLKRLISEHYGEKEEDTEVYNLPSGKPVATISGRELCASISHSGDFVAAAVGLNEVGIDIETPREIGYALLKRALNAEELSYVKKCESEALEEDEKFRFLQVWTAKEAYLKLTGEGLSGLSRANVLPLILSKESEGKRLESIVTKEYVCTVIEAL